MVDAATLYSFINKEPTQGSSVEKVLGFPFGLTNAQEIAVSLYKFADDILKGNIIIQEVQSRVAARRDDFTMNTLLIEYTEKREIPSDP